MKHNWIPRPGGTSGERWIDLISEDTANGMSDDHWRGASVKWDGCVKYSRFFNGPGPNSKDADDIHICDIDEEIEWLKSLKEAALAHFGKDWPR